MLRKAANEDGKDWDRLLLYLLFTYREVPQPSTGLSLFELLYGHRVRDPLVNLGKPARKVPRAKFRMCSTCKEDWLNSATSYMRTWQLYKRHGMIVAPKSANFSPGTKCPSHKHQETVSRMVRPPIR